MTNNYHGVLHFDVSVKYRTPTLYSVRSTGRLLARECPPSTPMRLHSCPFMWAALISATKFMFLFAVFISFIVMLADCWRVKNWNHTYCLAH